MSKMSSLPITFALFALHAAENASVNRNKNLLIAGSDQINNSGEEIIQDQPFNRRQLLEGDKNTQLWADFRAWKANPPQYVVVGATSEANKELPEMGKYHLDWTHWAEGLGLLWKHQSGDRYIWSGVMKEQKFFWAIGREESVEEAKGTFFCTHGGNIVLTKCAGWKFNEGGKWRDDSTVTVNEGLSDEAEAEAPPDESKAANEATPQRQPDVATADEPVAVKTAVHKAPAAAADKAAAGWKTRTETKVGIVIGSVVAVLLLGGGGFAIWYLYGQQNNLKARRQRLKNIAKKNKERR